MSALKAHVRGGRLLLDEPTDLPNGEFVELVPLDEVLAGGGDYLDAEERERLHASIDRGLDDVHAGSNSTRTSTSLSAVKSSRSTEPQTILAYDRTAATSGSRGSDRTTWNS